MKNSYKPGKEKDGDETKKNQKSEVKNRVTWLFILLMLTSIQVAWTFFCVFFLKKNWPITRKKIETTERKSKEFSKQKVLYPRGYVNYDYTPRSGSYSVKKKLS